MTDTTTLGFIYPEDDDYSDTKADVPRAVRELAESVDDFLLDPTAVLSLGGIANTEGTFSSLGFQNSWAEGVNRPRYRRNIASRVHLEGGIVSGSLDATVVTVPSGYGSTITQRWAVPYGDGDFAIVQLSGFDISVVFAPADPATEDISLDGVNWKATA